jgi:hypothetical protein|tara:strand:- start:1140 stop:1283 length:144 start_codon:yes stop_codon:yes gene_type:complete
MARDVFKISGLTGVCKEYLQVRSFEGARAILIVYLSAIVFTVTYKTD